VIEDDIYGDLHFGNERPWPIKAFDRPATSCSVHRFPRACRRRLRIGFVAAGRYRSAIALQKTITSGATNPLTQQVLAEYLESGAYERHLRGLRRAYERQVEAMRASRRHFPGSDADHPATGRLRAVGRVAGRHRYHRRLRAGDAEGWPTCRANCFRRAACTATACA
jgi:DNA-binding transcriptional MocR family regulator